MNTHEIAESRKVCVRDEPVFCTNACPLHVDVRLMVQKVQKGDFKGAFKHYQKQTLFAHILSRICEEPCKEVCKRKDLGGAIELNFIEKACAEYANIRHYATFAMPQRKQTVAVVGGGLCGMSCAVILKNKGYQVTLFEQSGELGGRIHEYGEDILPKQRMTEEINDLLSEDDLTIRLNTKITEIDTLDFDAICIATGKDGDSFGMELDGQGRVKYDIISFATSKEGVFAGGSMLNETDRHKPAESISHGIRIARTIERYFKKVSLTGEREKEAGYETRLMVDTSKEETVEPTKPAGDFYTQEEAITEAKRCMLCECRGCIDVCDLMQKYKNDPKKLIESINKTLITVEMVSTKVAARQVNSCNACGLCKEVCPKDLDMEEIFLSSRRILHRDGELPPPFHDFWINDMEFGNKEAVYGMQPATKASKYLFFPGCQMGASNPSYVIDSYAYLCGKLDGGVALDTSCCGAPAQWAGREKLHQSVLDGILARWGEQNKPIYILACPTCGKMFQKYLPQIEVQMLWNVIAKEGLPKGACKGSETLTIYDPCSCRFDKGQQQSVRNVVKDMGFTINELELNRDRAQCCSYGGLIYSANPSLHDEIVHKRIAQSDYPYVTYCTNCKDTFLKEGKRSYHVLDLLFGDYEPEAQLKTPTLGMRRENRLWLKQQLHKKLWGETIEKEHLPYMDIKLNISGELQKKMEKKLIMLDDVKRVIYHAQSTGGRMFNTQKNCYVAYLQEGIITFWVEYRELESGAFELVNVYSHRVKLGEKER